MSRRAVVRSVGTYLPERCVSNDQLAEIVDTSDAWIRERTGITQRYFASGDELTSDLGAAAASEALTRAGIDAGTIDMIIVATSTPDNTFPATATAIQQKIDAHNCLAFDIQAVCAGFPYALATADNFIKAGQVQRALVIGAETFSRILDFSDRNTCVLFGDGAGAFLIEADDAADQVERPNGSGILSTYLRADGRHYDQLFVDGGPSRPSANGSGKVGHLRMNGREVFRHAVTNLSQAATKVLADRGFGADDLTWLIPHQANQRIIDGVGKKLGVGDDRVISTVALHANTSAASIPLAFGAAIDQEKLRKGDLIVANAIGGGFAWGAVLLRW